MYRLGGSKHLFNRYLDARALGVRSPSENSLLLLGLCNGHGFEMF